MYLNLPRVASSGGGDLSVNFVRPAGRCDMETLVSSVTVATSLGTSSVPVSGGNLSAGGMGENPPRVTVIGESLRFGDRNPFTGESYAQSWFADLPGYAAHVVTTVLDITPGCWDGLVQRGRVVEAIGGLDVCYPVNEWLVWAARRWERPARSWECAECRGTCVEPDPDGSLTGWLGTPVQCWCVQGSIEVAPTLAVVSAGPDWGAPSRGLAASPGRGDERGVRLGAVPLLRRPAADRHPLLANAVRGPARVRRRGGAATGPVLG